MRISFNFFVFLSGVFFRTALSVVILAYSSFVICGIKCAGRGPVSGAHLVNVFGGNDDGFFPCSIPATIISFGLRVIPCLWLSPRPVH
uniref:Putative secreted protein n=1 Tax=Anopheles darlingi TaxID=43151 RepID=A0A2M4D5Y4_ANODA